MSGEKERHSGERLFVDNTLHSTFFLSIVSMLNSNRFKWMIRVGGSSLKTQRRSASTLRPEQLKHVRWIHWVKVVLTINLYERMYEIAYILDIFVKIYGHEDFKVYKYLYVLNKILHGVRSIHLILLYKNLWTELISKEWHISEIQHDKIQHNKTRFKTIQHNIMHYNIIHYNKIQCNTIQCKTLPKQYNTIQYNTIQCKTLPKQYNTIQNNARHYQNNTIRYNTMQDTNKTIQYNTIQYNTIQYNAVHTSVRVFQFIISREQFLGNEELQRIF